MGESAFEDFMSMPAIERCPFCSNRPQVIYEKNPVKVYLCCKGVSHIVRSLKFDTKLEAVLDWNLNVEKELQEAGE